MVAEILLAIAVVIATAAEMLHARRCARVARLVFGPKGRPSWWAHAAPFLRIAAIGALTWGLATLYDLDPKVHEGATAKEGDAFRHVVLVLDVSPSMRLEDAGPEGDQSRSQRAADILESFFARVAIDEYRLSVIAVYSDARPVVVDATDIAVVRNILSDLPMHFAFNSGKTDLLSGLELAAKTAWPWEPRSTTLILVSDGDTVPATGMPTMPASVANVLVVGVGDPAKGTVLNGRASRQDVSTLRQIAIRLGGKYHNGNEKHLSSSLLKQITEATEDDALERLTEREYALLAIALGASVLALLPVLLHYFGSRWTPGVPIRGAGAPGASTRQTARGHRREETPRNRVPGPV